ncbi:MAG: hypothetical protein GXP54_03425 [Deltaproteobacteria bacterium]|nr:hypothetical protein [Deltaproteobacteria bacterium]
MSRSRWLRLDVWAVSNEQLARLGADFRDAAPGRVKVSFAAVWHVTRANDTQKTAYQSVLDAMDPVWTFYAARLLSPVLADMLAPFRYLDEMPGDPSGLSDSGGWGSPFFQTFMESWEQHRVPTIPGLSFSAIPVRLAPNSSLMRRVGGTNHSGDLYVVGPGECEPITDTSPDRLSVETNHAGVLMTGPCHVPDSADAIAFIPHPPGMNSLKPDWIRTVAADSLTVLEVGLLPNDLTGSYLRLSLRVQDITVTLLDRDADVVARGRADLSYFHSRPHRPGGDFQDGPSTERDGLY